MERPCPAAAHRRHPQTPHRRCHDWRFRPPHGRPHHAQRERLPDLVSLPTNPQPLKAQASHSMKAFLGGAAFQPRPLKDSPPLRQPLSPLLPRPASARARPRPPFPFPPAGRTTNSSLVTRNSSLRPKGAHFSLAPKGHPSHSPTRQPPARAEKATNSNHTEITPPK